MKQKINDKLLDRCWNNLKNNYISYPDKIFVISESSDFEEIELYTYFYNDLLHHIVIKNKNLVYITRNKYLYTLNLYLLFRNFYEEEIK